jgi:hypothetical protein
LQVSTDDLVLNFDGITCVTLIAGVPDYVLLGNPLLRNFYTIYDMKNLRMGFAALPSYSLTTTKADPKPGQTPKLSLYDYTGDYVLTAGVSMA